MVAGVTVPIVNAGILSDVEMLLEAFKEKASIRFSKFHEVAQDFDLGNIYAGRLNLAELLEFEEFLLKAAFDYTRPVKETKMSVRVDRNLTERVFGIYACYVLYYAQPCDYVSKIQATPSDLVGLKQLITDVLLPGRHLDTIGCLYKLFVDDAFSTVAFAKCYDPTCHRGYTMPSQSDDVVDQDEKHTPVIAASSVITNPIMKTMACVQKEIEKKQTTIPGCRAIAEVGDNFLNRINKIYASLKREVEKVDVAQTDDSEGEEHELTSTEGEETGARREAAKQGPSRSSIKDKAYSATILFARNRRYADPNMHENFPVVDAIERKPVSGLEQEAKPLGVRKLSPRKRNRKLTNSEPISSDDVESGALADALTKNTPSKRRQKMKAPRRPQEAEKALSTNRSPKKKRKEKIRVTASPRSVSPSASSTHPERPLLDAEFEAEMRKVEALLEDPHSDKFSSNHFHTMGRSRRKTMTDLIPSAPKANITDSMRKERAAEGEVFENAKTARANSPEGSTRSVRSLTKSVRRKRNKVLAVQVLPPEPPIIFDNDVLSVYSQTQGTVSLDSVSEVESGPVEKIRKQQKASMLPCEKIMEAKRVKPLMIEPLKAIPVTDALFCERMLPEGPFKACRRRGDIEMEFLEKLIANVMTIVNVSGRTELEIRITISREDNGMPKLTLELIPKCCLRSPIERLNRAYVQYAKHHLHGRSDGVPEGQQEAPAEPHTVSEGANPGSRSSLLSVFNSMLTDPGTTKGK